MVGITQWSVFNHGRCHFQNCTRLHTDIIFFDISSCRLLPRHMSHTESQVIYILSMMFDIIINLCMSVFNLKMFYFSFLPLQSSDVWSFSCSSIPNGILIDFVWYVKFLKKKKGTGICYRLPFI